MGTLKVNGRVDIGNNLRLWSDGEGANLRLYTPGNSNNIYELDTCNNLLRLYYSTDGGSSNPVNWYFKNDGTFDSNSITAGSLSSGSISSGQIWITDGTSGTHPINQSLVLHSSKYTDINQAPGISGYIEGKNWSTLKFMPDGSWRFYDSACSSYYPVYASTFYGALSGNASSATEADKLDGYHASSFLLKSGGTMTGTLTINNSNSAGGYISFYEDSEGGTIRIGSKNGTYNWEMDAYNDSTFRIFSNGSGSYKFFSFNGSNGDFSVPGNLAIGGNTITFSGAMTQITSPTVVAGYINNNSANGMGWISTSSLSVGYAATAGGISSRSPVLAASGESNTLQAIDNYYYYKDTTLPIYHSLLAMVKVIDFQWFDSHWRIGNIRSGSTASYGFGFSFSADNQTHSLYTYINPAGCLWSKRLGTENYGYSLPTASVRGELFFMLT